MSEQKSIIACLSTLLEIQGRIAAIHILFQRHYPVTIVSNGNFHVYDVVDEDEGYRFVTSAPCLYPLPQGLLAAFPLDCYDGKTSAVITPDAFDTLEGYVYILHEFVHCAQSLEGEDSLKYLLGIARSYKLINDYMWEINHPFPYESPEFIHLYTCYMDMLSTHQLPEIAHVRRQLSSVLGAKDFEYLLWQEWKEGFARFLENKIRTHLCMAENHYGSEMPYQRASFYESGSRFLSALEMENPDRIVDMKRLFYNMKDSAL